MKLLSFASPKGDTGKSTLAVHTAVAAAADGVEVSLVDLDPQISACCWVRRRGDLQVYLEPHPDKLDARLLESEDKGTQFVVLDTPGQLGSALLQPARRSDLLPRQLDVEGVAPPLQALLELERRPNYVRPGREGAYSCGR